MIQTIRVTNKKQPDPQGSTLLSSIKERLHIKKITEIKTTKVFHIEGVTRSQAILLATQAFSEELTQDYTLNKPLYPKEKTIAIAYKPGVMNPEVGSIFKIARDLNIPLLAADTSMEYTFFGDLLLNEIEKIAQELPLYNPTIETIQKETPKTLLIKGKKGNVTTVPLRSLSDKELESLSQKKQLYLSLDEMKVIVDHFTKIKRDPTDCELEILAQTWSEHCVHKTFKADLTIDGVKKSSFIKRIKDTAKGHNDFLVSAFVDNSGVIDFYDGYGICGKVETHNSPSAIEPYGGAMTGSGGVFRDVLGTGQGAKALTSTDIFCFAPLSLPIKDVPPGCLPPKYLLKRVVEGVRDYGNRVGIPTNNGSVHFHDNFSAKPTVAVGAFGILPKHFAKKREPSSGDLVVTLGGRTGRDGIHGATFSSTGMTKETTTLSGTAVQIGNAIEEKRVMDAILKLRDSNLIQTITDCGAGGFSSAVGEMGKETGVDVHLDAIPLKYTGMAPWEIFLSESQERMVIAIKPKDRKKVFALCKLYNVEASVIGKFTNNKRLRVFDGKKQICDLDMHFMHDGLPLLKLTGITKKSTFIDHAPIRQDPLKTIWKNVLSHGNVCSKESIVRLYDHNVQGKTALHPFGGVDFDGPNDGSIVKPFFDKPYGMVTAHGLNPVLNDRDPYWGSVWAITEAVSNYVAIGGDLDSAALIDNFIWPFPDEASLADLDKSVDACTDLSKQLSLPFVSGKDSLSSTYTYPNGKKLKIPPVLLISVFGKIPDVTKTMSSDFKNDNSIIVHVGKADFGNLGGSTYFSVTKNEGTRVPRVDIATLPKTLRSITKGIQKEKLLAVHDISEGGIAAALAEMSFGGGIGATIDLKLLSNTRADFIFFQETAGTFLVEVKDKETAATLFKDVPHTVIGKTQSEKILSVSYGSKNLATVSITELKNAWQKPMKELFQ